MKALGWWIVIIALVAVGSRAFSGHPDASHASLAAGEVTSLSATPTYVFAAPPKSKTVNAGWSLTENQVCLRAVGYDVAVDGVFGPQTEAASAAWSGRSKTDAGVSDADATRCINAVSEYRASHAAAVVEPSSSDYSSRTSAGAPAYVAPVAAPSYVSPVPDFGARTQYVSGYTRKNGTYVAPYMRRPASH